jgi:hypothetical protein
MPRGLVVTSVALHCCGTASAMAMSSAARDMAPFAILPVRGSRN